MPSEATFDQQYLEREAALEGRQRQAYEAHERLVSGIRSRTGLSDEEREEAYIAGFEPLQRGLQQAADEHLAATENERMALERKVHEGIGERFGEHLTALASTPDERLPEIMATARRTGQKDLAQAVAETALDRSRFSIFEEWAAANPERGEALKRLRSLPDPERVIARTDARARVIGKVRGGAEALQPRPEDLEREASKHAAQEAVRAAFFDRPRRQVGSRIS